jgi:hypothetical protein
MVVALVFLAYLVAEVTTGLAGRSRARRLDRATGRAPRVETVAG